MKRGKLVWALPQTVYQRAPSAGSESTQENEKSSSKSCAQRYAYLTLPAMSLASTWHAP